MAFSSSSNVSPIFIDIGFVIKVLIIQRLWLFENERSVAQAKNVEKNSMWHSDEIFIERLKSLEIVPAFCLSKRRKHHGTHRGIINMLTMDEAESKESLKHILHGVSNNSNQYERDSIDCLFIKERIMSTFGSKTNCDLSGKKTQFFLGSVDKYSELCDISGSFHRVTIRIEWIVDNIYGRIKSKSNFAIIDNIDCGGEVNKVPVNVWHVLVLSINWFISGRHLNGTFIQDFFDTRRSLSRINIESIFWHRKIFYRNRMDFRELKDASASDGTVLSVDAEFCENCTSKQKRKPFVVKGLKNSVSWNLIHSVLSELVGIYCVLCQQEMVFENWRNGVFDCSDSCSKVQRYSQIQLDGRRKASTFDDIVWLVESIRNAVRIEKDVFWTENISVGNSCIELDNSIRVFDNTTEEGKHYMTSSYHQYGRSMVEDPSHIQMGVSRFCGSTDEVNLELNAQFLLIFDF